MFFSDEHLQNHDAASRAMQMQLHVQEPDEVPPSAEEQELDRTQRLIEITYMMTGDEIDFKKFPAIVELEKRHQVDLGVDTDPDSCEQFTKCIGEVFRKDLKQELSNFNYFSILVDRVHEFDSFTDVMLVYILFVDSRTGELVTRLLRLASVGDGSANDVKLAIESILEEIEITNRDKFVGLGYDSIDSDLTSRSKDEILALFSQDLPWLVSHSVYSHRLEQLVREIFSGEKMVETNQVLMLMKRLYGKIPEEAVNLKPVDAAMEIFISEPEKWVQHMCLCCKEVNSNRSDIMPCLGKLIKDFQPQVSKIFEKMASCDFLTNISFLQDFLTPLARASQALQRDALEVAHVLSALEHAKDSLGNFPGMDGKKLEELIAEFQSGNSTGKAGNSAPGSCTSSSETRNRDQEGSSDQQKSVVDDSKTDVSDASSQREFKPLIAIGARLHLEQEKLFEFAQILDTRLWPSDSKALREYGNALIECATAHFHVMFLSTRSEILSEWSAFKLFASRCLLSLKPVDVWCKLHVHYRVDYPNLVKLVEVLRVFPYSPELMGKCFSTLDKAKQDWRATLGSDTLEALLRIKHTDPPLKVNARRVAEYFLGECEQIEHPLQGTEACPGPSRSEHEENDGEPICKRPRNLLTL
jgi:hypothetical protein